MAMSLTTFIKTYQGKKVDFDNKYDAQCVDLYRQYLKECLCIDQTPGVDGAKEIWDKCGPQLKKIPDGVLAYYSRGDILIWGATSSNPYGHVAILVDLFDTKNFIVFEQDGFKKDGTKLTLRSREGLLGGLWLEGRY